MQQQQSPSNGLQPVAEEEDAAGQEEGLLTARSAGSRPGSAGKIRKGGALAIPLAGGLRSSISGRAGPLGRLRTSAAGGQLLRQLRRSVQLAHAREDQP
jgi:hypothetical protein